LKIKKYRIDESGVWELTEHNTYAGRDEQIYIRLVYKLIGKKSRFENLNLDERVNV